MNLQITKALSFAFCFACAISHAFEGLESPDLQSVASNDWGLKIVVFDVGQADSILLLTPNGDVALIDTGKKDSDSEKIANYLLDPSQNGIGKLEIVNLLFSTHYDRDHIGGLSKLVAQGISIEKALGQGPSGKRCLNRTKKGNCVTHMKSYQEYLVAVGDPDGDNQKSTNEPDFIRHKIEYDHLETIGQRVKILCVAVRGDTKGTSHDDPTLDPSNADKRFDENPGSIALLIRLGEFEMYTAGDQTSSEWKKMPAIEESVLASGAIPNGNDIDVLKVNHHGSDTSTGSRLAKELLPEVAIISAMFSPYELPKRIVLKQLEDNRSYVLITGNGQDSNGNYADSKTEEDDAYTPSTEAIFNNQGDITVLVSPDGSRYTVTGESFSKTFSAKDNDNTR